MKQIAIYGKGGIGKSTISANLSAALAHKNKKILQIGCDPKHDSTRLLLGDRKIITALDYIKTTEPSNWSLNDIVIQGYMDISCVEAGGPNPGVGCAGRGILTTFDLLERLDIDKLEYDIILYDVLGDVVCGGFAVPIRHEYADVVYIVSSGEFMSIYAANNILRGLKNYDEDKKRVGGIIFNKRGIEGEEERIKKFSQAVDVPVCAVFPRSDEFTRAEREVIPLVEMEDSNIAYKFMDLATSIIEDGNVYEAKPLTDEGLEDVILGNKKNVSLKYDIEKEKAIEDDIKRKTTSEKPLQYFSKNVLAREPLHGCAFNGAVNMVIQIEDAITVAHGPRSCAHISYQTITSIGRRTLFERGVMLPSQINPPIVSSEMNEGLMIFGGVEELSLKIEKLKKYKPKAIFIITTCPAGIIGDDIDAVKSIGDHDMPIIPIKTDGNIAGDYLQGMINSYIEVGRAIIKKDVVPCENCVNIIAEKPIAINTESNFKVIKEILEFMDIKINCRYICKTNIGDIKNFMKAKLNILAYNDYMGRMMRTFLEDEYDANFLDEPLPIGFSETEKWIHKVATYFGKREKADELIKKYENIYKEEIEKLKPYLKGKKIMIVTYNNDIDWIIETILELEMDILKICVLDFSQEDTYTTKFEDDIEIELKYDQNKRTSDIRRLEPDIVLSNYTSSKIDGESFTDNIPLCPDVGFFSGLNLARRWAGIFKMNLKEGWKKDEALFSKYYA